MTQGRPDLKDLGAALRELPEKPSNSASQTAKRRWSELLSEQVALVLASQLRDRGLKEALPAATNDKDRSGAERRMSGGIGAKKVDVTWTTPESGLLLGVSIKSINFPDAKTNNYQKNLTNRRGDMLFEAVTLHRRFPYAVLVGFFVFDTGAESDATPKRSSTFDNAHARFSLFTNRDDPYGRDEQFERFYFVLHHANRIEPSIRIYNAGDPDNEISLADALGNTLKVVAERNPDFYRYQDGCLIGQK